MTNCLVLRLPRRIQSQNRSQYSHWSHYRRERDAWFILLRQHLLPRRPAEGLVRLQIRSYRVRLCDYANFVGGCKPIPDCLVRLGYLKDDSPRYFDCQYLQVQVPRHEERTEIEFLAPLALPDGVG